MFTTKLPRAGVQRTPAGEQTEARARGALDRAVSLLLRSQHPDGSWDAGPRASVTPVTLNLLTRDLLGVLAPGHATLAAGLIRARQRADGSWARCPGGAPDRAATAACYLALRLAGDPADAYHMALTAGWLREAGGLRCADLVTTLWLALAGLSPWPYLTAVPPEALLLPGWVTGRLPGDRCRATIAAVPLAVIGSPLPIRRCAFHLNEIAPAVVGRKLRPTPADRPGLVDHVIRHWQRLVPVVPLLRHLRAAGNRRGAAWMIARQDPAGSWGGSEEVTALCLIALGQLGFGTGHRAMARGLSWLDQQAGRSWHEAGRGERDLAAVATDTRRAVAALVAAGLPPGHPALTRAAAFLEDPRARRRSRAPGRWPGSPLAPVIAESVLALIKAGLGASPQARRGVVWLLRAQSADGSWPEGGDGDVIVTADVVRTLIAAGVQPWKEPIGRAARWLADQQLTGRPLADGAPHGRGAGWSVVPGYAPVPTVTATATVVLALTACGNADSLACAERGVDWLASTQGDDGGWEGAQDRCMTSICHVIEALSSYLRSSTNSAMAGGYAAH